MEDCDDDESIIFNNQSRLSILNSNSNKDLSHSQCPFYSHGNLFSEAHLFYNLQAILTSLNESLVSSIQSHPSQFSSYINSKHKLLFSFNPHKYYFLSNITSISDISVSHFDYLSFIKHNYDHNKMNFPLLFTFISHKDKICSYNDVLSKRNSSCTICPYKGMFPKLKNLEIIRLEKTIQWRCVKSALYQSFYTCFVFALIEKWITCKLYEELFAFVLDVFRLKRIYALAFSYYDYTQFTIMVNLIYDNIAIENNDPSHILELFIDYFNSFGDIESILITYVKYCAYMYLQNTISNTNQLNYFDYEEIISLYHQPSLLIIELLSTIFNVNIDIYYPKLNAFNFECLSIKNENDSKLTIELCYLKGSYHLFYTSNIDNIKEQSHNNCLLFEPSDELTNLRCSHCGQKNNYIKYNPIKNDEFFCYDCLYKYILNIMKERAVLYMKHNYLYKELFTSPIPLSYALSMSDIEVYYCFKETLSDMLLNNITVKCKICNREYKRNDILSIECSCLYCEECLTLLIKDMSICEIGKIQVICKNCNEEIYIQDLVYFTDNTKDMYNKVKDAYFQNHCSLCGIPIEKDIIVPIKNDFDIENEKYSDIEHKVCSKCYKMILKHNKRKNKNNTNTCLICRKPHMYNILQKGKKCNCVIM